MKSGYYLNYGRITVGTVGLPRSSGGTLTITLSRNAT